MEEKNVVEGVDFPVRRTDNVGSFCAWHLQDSKKAFDSMPIKEIREACLQQINPDCEDNVDWLIKRVEAYLKMNDYETVCMLLRVLCRHQWSQKQRIVDVLVDSIRFGMNSSYASNNIKDMLVILCGKLQYEEKLYNENTRKLFQEIIEKFYDSSVYGSNENNYRLVFRVLCIIMAVKDDSFIPILEKIDINKKELLHLAKYVSICKERIGLEGLRMIVLRHLKGK